MRSHPETQAAFRAGLAGGPAPAGVTARAPDEVARRFAVYRNNVQVSLVEALRRRFPVVERLVGAEFARAMFGAFARAHPPGSPLMMHYGGRLPGFIERFGPAAGLPYLADVARLELARGRAYHAADAAALGPEALAAASERDAEALVFRLHASVEVLASAHPVHSIWAMNQPGAAPRPIARWGPESVLVARSGTSVLTNLLTPADAAFVRAMLAGGSLAAAGREAAGSDPEFYPALALARLIAAGLVVGAD